jgi:GNAT superfamily N-acetyltransferase
VIRGVQQEDYPELADLGLAALPGSLPTTATRLRHWFESEPPRARFRAWVAEEDSQLVGCAMAAFLWSLRAEDVAWLQVALRPAPRGRGLCGCLYSVAEQHLLEHGAKKLETFALEGSPGQRFAEARGFRRTRRELLLRLRVAEASVADLPGLEASAHRDGFRLLPLRELAGRRRDVHALYVAASADIPADDPEDNIPYEDWERQDLGDPELSWEGSFVVVDEQARPVALAFLVVNRVAGVAVNEMTGTLPEHRRRGLARLAKLATIRWAREQGIRELGTENDAENVGMRALNESLGYRVCHVRAVLAQEVS